MVKAKVAKPTFRNKTRIDQVVYDESFSPILVPAGKTIKGEHFRVYAGKGGPLEAVDGIEQGNDEDEKETKLDEQGRSDTEIKG